MSGELKTNHPLLMVPHVVSMSVVIYTNGPLPPLSADKLRQALIQDLPAGSGVSSITFNIHGVYEGQQGATRRA